MIVFVRLTAICVRLVAKKVRLDTISVHLRIKVVRLDQKIVRLAEVYPSDMSVRPPVIHSCSDGWRFSFASSPFSFGCWRFSSASRCFSLASPFNTNPSIYRAFYSPNKKTPAYLPGPT